jgi:hypothetical protein
MIPRMASIMFQSNMLVSLMPHNRYNMLECMYHMQLEQSLDLKKIIQPYLQVRLAEDRPSIPHFQHRPELPGARKCSATANPCVTSASRSIVHFSARRLN